VIDSAVLRLHPSSILKLPLREDPCPKGGKAFCLLDSRSCVCVCVCGGGVGGRGMHVASFFNLGVDLP